jgi:glucosyl-dolichyl phosphate glucuronosyltransferase
MLARALQSVAEAASPDDLVEVIVVDNGSTDETPDVCAAIRARFPRHPWRYCYDEIPGLLTGRHRGAAEAQGDLLCYLDDDVLLGPRWPSAVKEAFRDPNVALVGGPSSPLYEARPPSWLGHLWRDIEGGRMLDSLSLIDCGDREKAIEPYFVWGLNFAIRRAVLYDCGGFHPDGVPPHLIRFRGDGEGGLAYKIQGRALRAVYHPDARVAHVIPASRLTVGAFERRAFSQGVSDSFTRIRADGAVAPDLPGPSRDRAGSWPRWRLRASLLWSNGAAAVCALLARAHAAGVAYHQEEVRNDPALLAWVLRPDYLDYRLPEGWGPVRA